MKGFRLLECTLGIRSWTLQQQPERPREIREPVGQRRAGETRTGVGRETDATREIGKQRGNVTDTVKERETGIVAATD